MSNTLIDNSCEELMMTNVLRNELQRPYLTNVYIATGYWDLPGLSLVKDQIRSFLSNEGTKLHLLIGRDPFVFANQLKEPRYKDLSYPQDFIRTDINDLDVIDAYKDAVNLLLDFCTEANDSKIEIRIFRRNEHDETQFLHSKCYIFEGKDKQFATGIVGSSNFTQKGLEGNAELNYLEETQQIVLSSEQMGSSKGHRFWFREKWDISQPWNREFMEQVLDRTKLGEEVKKERKKKTEQPPAAADIAFTPYEAYIRMLHEKFGTVVDVDMRHALESYLPHSQVPGAPNYMALDYQIEAVQWCYQIMKLHGGFMLGDVVGIGKTIVGALLIKYFIETCDINTRSNRVLIVSPPAIKANWQKTIADFDYNAQHPMSQSVMFVTTGSVGKLLGNDYAEADDEEYTEVDELPSGDFGLIIIDESHRFRRRATQMYERMTKLIDGTFARKGYFPYIGLLSATPQNNYPSDLRNQIALFERTPGFCTLEKVESRDLDAFFARLNREYYEVIHTRPANPEELKANRKRLNAITTEIRDKILADILVRRTRADIKRYANSNLTFPTVKGPETLVYRMNQKLANLFFDTMNILMPCEDFKFDQSTALCYYRYRATQYLTPELQKRYTVKSVDPVNTSLRLAGIMQNLLVKRLECSFGAFVESLKNLLQSCRNMEMMWDDNTIFVCPDIDVNAVLNRIVKGEKTKAECYDILRQKITALDAAGKNRRLQNCEYRCDDFAPEYIDLLRQDRDIVISLLDRWRDNRFDPKLDRFKEVLNTELMSQKRNKSQKLVIFTEAIATAQELEDVVRDKGHSPLLVTAQNRAEQEMKIRQNFDANHPGEQFDDYDVIITTDVLAEGINLHRANVILNYDTPWNATRLMQRIGRVNRIGSQQTEVWVYNFYPSAEGDSEINLVRNAYTKIQAFHTLFGEDNKVFSDDEKLSHIDYQHMIDGDESPYQELITELKHYKQNNADRYQAIATAPQCGAARADATANIFAVRTAQSATSLYVTVTPEGEGSVMPSCIEAFEQARCLPTDTSAPLPANIEQSKQKAVEVWQQHMNQIFRHTTSNTAHSNEAKTIVLAWINKKDVVEREQRKLLKQANQMIKAGNKVVAKIVIAMGEELNNPELQPEQINSIINEKLNNLSASEAIFNHGEPYVVAFVCAGE